MTPLPPEPPQAKALLPLLALIFAGVGFCLPPFFLVGLVLAVISLVKSNQPAYAARKTLAFVTLGLGFVYVPLMGVLLAIAIPNFVRYGARSKQSECKVNLKMAYSAEKAFYADHDAYSTSPAELGLEFEKTRYLYRFDRLGPLSEVGVAPTLPTGSSVAQLENGIPPGLRERLGVAGTCPDCNVTVLCAGNIDGDPGLDVWSISTADRTGAAGEPVTQGMLYNDVNDLGD